VDRKLKWVAQIKKNTIIIVIIIKGGAGNYPCWTWTYIAHTIQILHSQSLRSSKS